MLHPIASHRPRIADRADFESALTIDIISGSGVGQTSLSAFDAALFACGAHNCNLISLSSVIPPGATIFPRERFTAAPGGFGDRLYVVKAEMRAETPGAVIAAGLGWFQLQTNVGSSSNMN